MTNLNRKEGIMLDLKEEQEYKQLRELGQKLHIPIPEHFIELEVFDKDGKLIQKHRQRSHSWVRNAYNTMFSQLALKDGDDAAFGAGKLNFKNTAAAVINAASAVGIDTSASMDAAGDKGYIALATSITNGILVGSGTNAEDFEDYVLQTPMAEGNGAGELNHVQSQPHSISYAALTLKDELVRYFNNNSGGNIDVNEVALVIGSMSNLVHHCLMCRDKLASTVTVPDTGQLKVTYTIQLTYPS